MKPQSILVPDQEIKQILDSLRRIFKAERLVSTSIEQTLGLSGAQLTVLQRIKKDETISLNDLAERTKTHQSSVSVVVSRLVDQGYLVRSKAKDDARRLEISLTEKAQDILSKAPHVIQSQLISGLLNMPGESRQKLAELLTLLTQKSGLSDLEPTTWDESPEIGYTI